MRKIREIKKPDRSSSSEYWNLTAYKNNCYECDENFECNFFFFINNRFA